LQDSNDPQAHFWAPSIYDDETLKFSLRVQDSKGNSDESPVSVRVNTVVDSNDQPHADAGGDQTVDEGQWVTLDGDGSYDPNGDELDYSWTQTSGQGVDLQDDDQEQAQFRAPWVNDDISLKFELRVEDQNGKADEDSTTVNVNGINYNSDNLPCVQTYDTAHGTYVTDCNDNGNLPILPPCQPGSINPNCKPVPQPLCQPGSINPNCKPVPQPLKPNTQPKKVTNNPVKENNQPKKIETKQHKSQKPPSNPPKPPTQKFKSSGSSGGSGGSKLRR
jgi:hypothetical protein